MAWTLRLSESEEAALSAQAVVEGRSKQEIVRDALRTYMIRQRAWDEFVTDEPVVYRSPATGEILRTA
ncbi:ribbon-helix-helix protein, CopG family [Nocardia sp. 2]|uniref:Ribbon-helix-helix protein, CopG family n=1 Tax=Nocardia acididurans TaxID=2802282 RepID=A0ABS1MDZ2_9NOCA|nr:ribbon-helix-helix protein, CopG family [Nocardia acididurans]MBL1078484.1 ribbon-helix-helix protein, CopG family [Nocardia acididurans]